MQEAAVAARKDRLFAAAALLLHCSARQGSVQQRGTRDAFMCPESNISSDSAVSVVSAEMYINGTAVCVCVCSKGFMLTNVCSSLNICFSVSHTCRRMF